MKYIIILFLLFGCTSSYQLQQKRLNKHTWRQLNRLEKPVILIEKRCRVVVNSCDGVVQGSNKRMVFIHRDTKLGNDINKYFKIGDTVLIRY